MPIALLTLVTLVPLLSWQEAMNIYPSSHNHGSGKWVPPIVVSVDSGSFSSMTMGEMVIFVRDFLDKFSDA